MKQNFEKEASDVIRMKRQISLNREIDKIEEFKFNVINRHMKWYDKMLLHIFIWIGKRQAKIMQDLGDGQKIVGISMYGKKYWYNH